MEVQNSKTWLKLLSQMGERDRRLSAAQKAIELGHGGIVTVHRLTGLSQTTIAAGIKELKSRKQINLKNRTRRPGGGRKSVHENQPELKNNLIKILEETTAGDPMSALRWTSKSLTKITDTLIDQGFTVSRQTVHGMIKAEGYSLRGNLKTIEGKQHPDRDIQFKYINDKCAEFFLEEAPVLSVDTKKKELVGNFKNSGKELCKKDKPTHVNT